MNTRLIGALGEQIAARNLRKMGFRIFSSNFVTANGELDLVAVKEDTIHFVEVKTRTEGAMLRPAEAVDYKKQENIKSAAALYLNKYKFKYNKISYDIFEVILNNDNKYLKHNFMENQF